MTAFQSGFPRASWHQGPEPETKRRASGNPEARLFSPGWRGAVVGCRARRMRYWVMISGPIISVGSQVETAGT